MDKAEKADLIPWPTFSEEQAVNDLIAKSEQFATYYKTQRGKLLRPIVWALDNSMKEDKATLNVSIGRGDEVIQVIRMKGIPPKLEDAGDVAHALETYILEAEGFPSTYYVDERFSELCGVINNTIIATFVDSRLKAYGFDPIYEYKRRLDNAHRELEKFQTSPTQNTLRLKWIFKYVAMVLYREACYGYYDEIEDEFRTWFDERYPDIAQEGQELLTLIRSIGYDTPDKMKKVFKKIIPKYRLNGFLFV